MDNSLVDRWQSRIEKGLIRLLEKPSSATQKSRFQEALKRSRVIHGLKSPVARVLNSLGEIGLSLGFQLLAIILFRKSEQTAPNDPLPKINLSRSQMSLANKFLLRAPVSGAVSHNLTQADKRLDTIILKGKLPEHKLVEVTLLKRRIEDRLQLWQDIRKGETPASAVKDILHRENEHLKPVMGSKMPSIEELEKMEPRRTGFYYRDYREQQKKKKGS